MKLTNVRIINHDEIIQNADVTIENGEIKKITIKEGKATSTLIPGFIDTHIHGFGGNDCMDSKEAVEKIAKDIAKYGTTSFMPTVMTEKWETLIKIFKSYKNIKSSGAEILGIHLEGPFISVAKKGAHNEKYIIKPSIAKIDELIKASNNMLKKITIAPEESTPAVIKHIASNNIIVSIGHTNGKAKDVEMASKNGATSATHLWNAMTGVENRNPGVVEAVLNDESIYAEMILDLLHTDKDAIKLSINAKTPARMMAVTDALRAAGLKDGDYKSGGLAITKKGSMITLKDKPTLAGSAATMYDCYINLLKLGVDEKNAVAMTSYNAAENLNLENVGYIAVGLKANLIVLDSKKAIKTVLINGIKVN